MKNYEKLYTGCTQPVDKVNYEKLISKSCTQVVHSLWTTDNKNTKNLPSQIVKNASSVILSGESEIFFYS